ncbi:hypothetical protein HK104_000457 [Borealophlyctis nickersoniae]|nr:hypothetical protein HK104_000457 [Borealophlyctis nickersoniae]
MYGCMVVIIAWLFAPVKLVVTGDYEMLGEGKRQVVMANHQIYPDWWYMWCLFHNRNAHGDVKILLIKYLKHIPIFGWGMRFFEFIFMNRKWALDKENLTSHLRRAKEDNLPLMLLLYPEGNLNTPNNRESCRAYAKKMDISEDPKHVVLPKSTGLKTCLEALAPEVHELFDVTVGYSGLTADQVPYDEYLAEQVFFGGIYPAEVHLHIRRFDVAKLPGFEAGVGAGFDTLKDEGIDVGAIGAERFNLWLRARWMQKDELMDGFYKNGVFGGEEGVTNARKDGKEEHYKDHHRQETGAYV